MGTETRLCSQKRGGRAALLAGSPRRCYGPQGGRGGAQGERGALPDVDGAERGAHLPLRYAETKQVLESNAAFRSLMGFSEEELLGMRIYDFIDHDRDNIDQHVRRSLKEKQHHTQARGGTGGRMAR